MKNKLIYWLAGLGLLGACQEWAIKENVDDPQGVYTNAKKSDLRDTLQMNNAAIREEYEKAGSRWKIHEKNHNQCIIDKVTVHEGTIYPEIEHAMFEAATYNMEYQKDTIDGDSITSWWEKFLDMPVWCYFMLWLINNGWITYQDLLKAANNHDISGLASKAFNREYPEWPLTPEQAQQKKEDKEAFIRMSLNACRSNNYDIVEEYISWIQTIRKEAK